MNTTQTDIDRRTEERRSVVRQAIDMHEAYCPCGKERRQAEADRRRQPEELELTAEEMLREHRGW